LAGYALTFLSSSHLFISTINSFTIPRHIIKANGIMLARGELVEMEGID